MKSERQGEFEKDVFKPSRIRMVRHGIRQKIRAIVKGEAEVPWSCQIRGIRKIYNKAGLSPTSGIFVEIGAFDGHSFSNTSFLADQGWRGVYFEPIHEYAALAKSRHFLNRIKICEFAISSEEGPVNAYKMGPLSTLDRQTYLAYANTKWANCLENYSGNIDGSSLSFWANNKTFTSKGLQASRCSSIV